MKDKLIENFIRSRGGDCNQRIERDNGGQYLINFLKEFASFVKYVKSNNITLVKKVGRMVFD